MPAWLHAFRASFTFLTRIPVGGFPYPEDLGMDLDMVPARGCLLGALYAAIWMGLEGHSDPTRAIIVVTMGLLVTGGFHEDGLSDSVDALGGAYDRENVMRILKDSRVGAFGALALIVAVMLKVSLLVDLGVLAPVGLVLGQSLRGTAGDAGLQPHARRDDPQSKSRDVARLVVVCLDCCRLDGDCMGCLRVGRAHGGHRGFAGCHACRGCRPRRVLSAARGRLDGRLHGRLAASV